jgi:hypothetical protein
VQPLRARPLATTLKISANRVNMVDLLPAPYYSASSLAFSSYAGRTSIAIKCALDEPPPPV